MYQERARSSRTSVPGIREITVSTHARPLDSKGNEPITKYQQLDREIAALMQRSAPQQNRYNPYQARADEFTALVNALKAQQEKLEKPFGPANGMVGGQTYAQSTSGSARSVSAMSSPHIQQQQPVPDGPVAPVRQANQGGQAGSRYSG